MATQMKFLQTMSPAEIKAVRASRETYELIGDVCRLNVVLAGTQVGWVSPDTDGTWIPHIVRKRPMARRLPSRPSLFQAVEAVLVAFTADVDRNGEWD